MLNNQKASKTARIRERAFWLPVIEQALHHYERTLKHSGIVQNLFSDSQERSHFIEQASCSLVWSEASRLAEDDLLGLRINRLFCPTPLNALALTAQASSNIGAAINNLTRFFPIVSTQVKLEMRLLDAETEIRLQPQGTPHAQHIEAILGYLARLLTQLDLDNQGLVTRVNLIRPDSELVACARLLDGPEAVSAEHYSLIISRDLLDKPLASADPFLLPRLTEAMQDLLANLPSSDLVEQVKRRIQLLLGSGDVSAERVAVPMNISPRHLRRKLSQEDTSYEQLVDEVRKEAAVRMISEGQLSLTSIAYELGFLDPSSFTRAFRRWTDMSPTAFRRKVTQKD
ncbi:AraC family transcriptional regulator [Pseudomonas jilinensis]|uniref:HTH araC/xylS-type domain-containing protein n=1 Tax=Pseudomonas jilinensis TaxID=2078689 RepID=A0A396RZQ4_9PSED|nr:AraC family transcriptional regulator [Pseudomonas jilinensis]RHW22098.1 hypothetical protein C2846_06465 [Pseudomonas jilinensis]